MAEVKTTDDDDEWIKSSFSGKNDLEQICDMYSSADSQELFHDGGEYENVVGLFVVCGSWNGKQEEKKIIPFFETLLKTVQRRNDTSYRTGIIHVDSCDETLSLYCGDNNNCNDDDDEKREKNHQLLFPCPPDQLPAVLLIMRRSTMQKPEISYLLSFKSNDILSSWKLGQEGDYILSDSSKIELLDYFKSFGLLGDTVRRFDEALRIFVAGDRMSVGKTSVCLGLLGNLISMGYSPGRLAYIKPATQDESTQLVQRYCEKMGIDCVPIGPVVYYRGFTRAFLAGQTSSTDDMLQKVEHAVDKLSIGKDVVVVDGVGFPAVGSICGTDNASVAMASSYPHIDSSSGKSSRKPLGVLLVGGAGVGSAVDTFNLNATYFEHRNIPVLGPVFNKLSLDGYYSLENCKREISLYFSKNDHQIRCGRKPFGFIPLFSKIGGDDALDHVYDFIRVFGEHFDLKSLLDSAAIVQQSGVLIIKKEYGNGQQGLEHSTILEEGGGEQKFLSRNDIENSAIDEGAAPST
ncbi:MAG: dethiobiotin synthetase [Bacillariaceae sp.]|jgi:dethiobiotin synthetase